LLGALGVSFRIVVPDIQEVAGPGERAAGFVLRMAREKGDDVAPRAAGAPVLSADTVVELDGRILGKPSGFGEAREMLGALSGREHSVFTGVVLRIPDRCSFEEVVETRVWFDELDEAGIGRCLEQEGVLDKAGAYAIQGVAGSFVPAIRGSYSNVVGLPLAVVFDMLDRAGLA
jgi:septum formation protein